MLIEELQTNCKHIIDQTLIDTIYEGTTVIQADQNAPRPAVPYLSVKTIASNQRGKEAFIQVNDNDLTELHEVSEFSLSVQGFGVGSGNILNTVRQGFNKPSVQYYCDSLEIAIYTRSNITDISVSLDQTIEKRYLFEITGGIGNIIEDDNSYITSALITGEVTDVDESIKNVSIDIDVSV